ncbi:helix-turn-helix transcriptional regulator [Bacillus wiedmannii]|uniref:Transcriptional regulator n=1 Tax=Bacillus thuringiensis TaxID=1428 RepID=A0A4V2WC38_BACTU|nr:MULTISPECIES: helix-turn-helix transcriptional regulator [Bacillus cereus group]MED2040998.1 helix-turn-helix transcriptional regulator [Bacillus wiedmannii]TCW45798.1 transcriptional regulator [Bacillus thuringiensis]TCW46352.1 transcriptional regulator [Bacillus thuringiensis]
MLLKTRIKEYRVRLNMSQEDLAKEVGVRRETIGNLENGKYNPSFKLTYDIAKVLKVPIEVLFWFEEYVVYKN